MLETPYLWKSPAITEDFARKQFLSPADVGRASPEKATASEAEEEQSEYNEDDDDEPLDTRYFDTLPSEPPGPCDPLVQSQVGTFMDTYAGTDFTTSLKRKKDFGNPEILKKVREKEYMYIPQRFSQTSILLSLLYPVALYKSRFSYVNTLM